MRCLIVDDSADFVGAARGLLEFEGIPVVGTASTGAEALCRFEELLPDITLLDVDLGNENGFDVAEQLHALRPSAQVILISTHSVDDFADMVAASPAIGFIPKSGLTVSAICDLIGESAALREGDHL